MQHGTVSVSRSSFCPLPPNLRLLPSDFFLCRWPPQLPPTPPHSVAAMLALWNRSLESLAPSQRSSAIDYTARNAFFISSRYYRSRSGRCINRSGKGGWRGKKLCDDATLIRGESRESPRSRDKWRKKERWNQTDGISLLSRLSSLIRTLVTSS